MPVHWNMNFEAWEEDGYAGRVTVEPSVVRMFVDAFNERAAVAQRIHNYWLAGSLPVGPYNDYPPAGAGVGLFWQMFHFRVASLSRYYIRSRDADGNTEGFGNPIIFDRRNLAEVFNVPGPYSGSWARTLNFPSRVGTADVQGLLRRRGRSVTTLSDQGTAGQRARLRANDDTPVAERALSGQVVAHDGTTWTAVNGDDHGDEDTIEEYRNGWPGARTIAIVNGKSVIVRDWRRGYVLNQLRDMLNDMVLPDPLSGSNWAPGTTFTPPLPVISWTSKGEINNSSGRGEDYAAALTDFNTSGSSRNRNPAATSFASSLGNDVQIFRAYAYPVVFLPDLGGLRYDVKIYAETMGLTRWHALGSDLAGADSPARYFNEVGSLNDQTGGESHVFDNPVGSINPPEMIAADDTTWGYNVNGRMTLNLEREGGFAFSRLTGA